MKPSITFSILFAAIAIVGCNVEEKDYSKAEEENTPSAYKEYLRKYPASEYANEARFRAAMADGSLNALVDYLGCSSTCLSPEWVSIAADSAMGILAHMPTEDVLKTWQNASSPELKARIEQYLLIKDEESAWAMVEKISQKRTQYDDSKIRIYDKYLSAYADRSHFAEVKNMEKKLRLKKKREEELAHNRQWQLQPEPSQNNDYGACYRPSYEFVTVPIKIFGITIHKTRIRVPAQKSDATTEPYVSYSEHMRWLEERAKQEAERRHAQSSLTRKYPKIVVPERLKSVAPSKIKAITHHKKYTDSVLEIQIARLDSINHGMDSIKEGKTDYEQ